MPRSLAGSLCVPPVPSLCDRLCPPLVSVVGTVRHVPRSQFLSEVRVVSGSPRNMAGKDICFCQSSHFGRETDGSVLTTGQASIRSQLDNDSVDSSFLTP